MADSLNDIAQRIANAQAGGSRYPFLNEEGIGDVVVTDYGFENTRQIGQVFNIYVRVINWQPTKPGPENEIAPGAMRTVQVKMKNDNANSLLKEFALGVTQGLAYAATVGAGGTKEAAFEAAKQYTISDVDTAAVLSIIDPEQAAAKDRTLGVRTQRGTTRTNKPFTGSVFGPPDIIAREGGN